MKNKIISTLTALGLLSSMAFADETYKPNQIYFGPELLQVTVDTTIKNVRVKGRKHFSGIRLGYEYLKPWSFYAGADIVSTVSSQHYSATQNGESIYSSDQHTGFSNLDLRFGYTTAPKQLLFTPYLGVGTYSLGSIPHNRGFHEGWAYVSTGLRSKFPINAVFALGINLKLFKSVFSYQQFQNHTTKVTQYSYPWGAEIGVPFIWNFNPRGTWAFQIEPYWTKLNFSEKQDVVGSKFLIEVHF